MFVYCPACASKEIRFEKERVWLCPGCGFTYFHNIATGTACVIRTNSGLLFLVRAKDPGKGKLDLPGGFVDPGEGAEEGLKREIMEELGLDLTSMSNPNTEFALQTPGNGTDTAIHGGTSMSNLIYLGSFPNKYLYKKINYNTCDLVYFLDAPELTEKDIKLDITENSELRFIKPEEINMEDIAFESIRKGVELFISRFASKPD